MVPVVALLGRKNVGKSTLFNQLTCTCDALVGDFPGLTRDRKYGHVELDGYEFICIDTSGIERTKIRIEECMIEQSFLAIKEANIILFIVDARSGLMPDDSSIANYLRAQKKPTILVVNKTDGINIDQAIAEFWALGFKEIHPISASHRETMSDLLKNVLLPLIKEINLLNKNSMYLTCLKKTQNIKDDFNHQALPIKLAIVGSPNVGKSTLANCILGKKRMVVCDVPGTTRDCIYIPTQYNDQKYVLIDTAGVQKWNKITNIFQKFSIIKTLKSIKNASVVLLVISADKGISNQDLSLLDFIFNSGRSLVIVVNKWDILSNKTKKQIKNNINYRLNFIKFIRVHFISALYRRGISNLFKSVYEAYNSSTRHQSASVLTRIMNTATEDHQPPLIRGRRANLKYAHMGKYNPLTIVIHGNQVNDLPNSYKRYLVNYFRRSLDIIGAPIFIRFKTGKNPFTKKQ